MENTEKVVIPRELAHRVTSLLMALEDAWRGNAQIQHEVSTLAKEFINATKSGSRQQSSKDIQSAARLIPHA